VPALPQFSSLHLSCRRASIAASFPIGELGEGSFFEGYKKDEENAWKLLTQFNFDRRGLTFNFSPYDVLPYVYGSHEVLVPWRVMDDMVSEENKRVVERITTRSN